MQKLNNKGITTIEVIICFVLVVIVTISMYSTISYFNEKRLIENYKEQVYSYKDNLTKDIQDDFIKIGLTKATYKKEVIGNITTHTVDCVLKDGTKRKLIVEQRLSRSSYHLAGYESQNRDNPINDYFRIRYGKENELVEYPLPDLGESEQGNTVDVKCNDKNNTEICHTVKDLSINNIFINITDDHVLTIYIGFYHPELSTRYGVNIVTPIDYASDGGAETGTWNFAK